MKSQSTMGLSILAGGLAFAGSASAVDIVVDGSYESATNNYVSGIIANGGNDAAGIDGGWTHFSTYNYSAAYTQTGPAGSGAVYLRPYNDTGGSTTVSQINSLTRAIPAASIDGGGGQYTLSAWFSTYRGQNDYSTLSLQFLDSSQANIGSPIVIGGAAFVAGLPGGNNFRPWGQDTKTGPVPPGARYAAITTVATALVNLPDGYVDLVKLDITTNATIALVSAAPANDAVDVSPAAVLNVVLQDGLPTPILNPDSIRLSFDDSPVSPSVEKVGALTTVQYDPPGLLMPRSTHRYQIAYNNTGGATPNTTNLFSFTVLNYYNYLLPSPIVLETFDSTPEGSLPAGWSSSSFSGVADTVCDPLSAGIGGLQDLHSACYTNWVVVNSARFNSNLFTYASHDLTTDYQRVLSFNPVNVVNGAIVQNLAQGNIVFGNSGYQDASGSQIVYLFSPDFDLAGETNVYLAFNSLWEQNQDSIAAVEYSIDEGATWLPVVYLLDGSDILQDADGSIDAKATFGAVRIGDFEGQATYVDPTTMQTAGGYYGAFIGVDSNRWAELGPYISARVDDDPVDSKRIEAFRLPSADNQSKVRLRFAHAGTDSWYFGLDNVGLYSISVVTPPTVGVTPATQTERVGNTALFNANVSGLGPFSYQWQLGGANLSGATNSTLARADLQLSQAGDYSVVVGYVGGSTTSAPVTLIVLAPSDASVIGQWDFLNDDFRATVGADLEPADGPTFFDTQFGSSDFFLEPDKGATIDGAAFKVMSFPGAVFGGFSAGYRMRHGLGGTGGGTNVNSYTLIADLLYPTIANNVIRGILQTHPDNLDNADIYLNEANGLGVSGVFQGNFLPDTWQRVAVTVDLSGPGPSPILAKFINGVKVGQQTLTEGVDRRWSLSANPDKPWALLFTDDDGGVQQGYVSSIQLRKGRLSDAEIVRLGRATANKIPGAIASRREGGNIVIQWSGGVPLQGADDVTGPWTDVEGAASPYTVTGAPGDRKFYRPKL